MGHPELWWSPSAAERVGIQLGGVLARRSDGRVTSIVWRDVAARHLRDKPPADAVPLVLGDRAGPPELSEDAFRDAVVDMLRRVGRMRDDWAESNQATQNALWRSVHTAADHVGAILDAEDAHPWGEELARLDASRPPSAPDLVDEEHVWGPGQMRQAQAVSETSAAHVMSCSTAYSCPCPDPLRAVDPSCELHGWAGQRDRLEGGR